MTGNDDKGRKSTAGSEENYDAETVGYVTETPDYSGSTEEYDSEEYVSVKKASSPARAAPVKRTRGRPRGKAKPKVIDFTVPGSIQQRHVRRDNVDEECEAEGVIYKRWVPLNPGQTSHVSVRDWEDETIVPQQQTYPGWCVMCPKTKFMKNEARAHVHYLAWHHKTLLVVENWKILACKCSEVRSHGRDNSARNKHYHCPLCYHPHKTDDQLGTHMITQHREVTENMVRHLLNSDNSHRT